MPLNNRSNVTLFDIFATSYMLKSASASYTIHLQQRTDMVPLNMVSRLPVIPTFNAVMVDLNIERCDHGHIVVVALSFASSHLFLYSRSSSSLSTTSIPCKALQHEGEREHLSALMHKKTERERERERERKRERER